jgi:type I restriction enzyme S subunit
VNTKQLRQKVLDLAIRGKLVPQDPDDEPASVLLERVRAEKERLIKEGKIKRDKRDSYIVRGDDKSHYEQVPQGWAWVRLGDICNSVLGKMLDVQKNKGEYKPYLRNLNVRWGKFDLTDILEMRFEDSEYERYRVERGDLIICEGGEPGRCAVWENDDVDMRFQKALHRIRPFTGVVADYLYFVTWQLAQNDELETYFTGSTIKHLTGQSLALIPVPLPPTGEQKRIVSALNSTMAVIDEIDEHKSDLASAVASAKSKILALAIRGKLVPQDPNDEPASILLERIRSEREKLVKEGKIKRGKNESAIFRGDDNSYYAGLPKSWATCRIGQLCTLQNGRAFKPSDWAEKGLPIIRIQNLNDIDAPYNHFDDNIDENHRLYGGELLFAWSGTPGTSFGAHIWNGKEAVLNQHIFRVDYYQSCVDRDYFKHAINFRLDELIDVAHGGAGLQHVTKGMFEDTIIPLPPLAEQQRIVRIIETAFEQLDSIAKTLE